MAGRGRGRGAFSSLNTEALGIKPNQLDLGSNDPPPVYPPLGTRPQVPLKLPEHDYMLAVMKDFVNHMRDSQFAVSSDKNKNAGVGVNVGRYSDAAEVNKTQKSLTGIDWKRYPKELVPSSVTKKSKSKRSNQVKVNLSAKRRKATSDPDKLLDKLEKNEEDDKNNKDQDEDDDDKSNRGSDKEDEDEREEVEDDDNVDEELDEGTDYANNYFDNGENYLDDEDDNLDEGGIF